MTPVPGLPFKLHQRVLTPDGEGLVWGGSPENRLIVWFKDPRPGLMFNGHIGEYDPSKVEQVPLE